MGCAKHQDTIVTINGNTMGTTYSIKYAVDEGTENKISADDLKEYIEQRLKEINQLMSTYIPDSELSIINRSPANIALKLSPETEYVIAKAIELNELSSGKLDITVGPLVNLWGFGPTKRPEKTPTKEEVEAVRDYVGIDKFVIDDNKLIKLHDKVYIDLSTIAKGYGVDAIAKVLESLGVFDYLVEIGGEMKLSGLKPNQQAWVVAIEKPVSNERAIQRIINVGNNAIATSGDYRNYFEQDGIRYSHLIDPDTALPIQHKLVSVTVVADTALLADGLATALIVLGEEKGQELAERENIKALFIVKEGNEFVEYESNAFKTLVMNQNINSAEE